MSSPTLQFGTAYNRTSTGDVSTRDTVMIGFYVNSTTAGTLVFRRGGSAGTAISGTITPAIGFHPFPAAANEGLHVTVGNTINVTIFAVEGMA